MTWGESSCFMCTYIYVVSESMGSERHVPIDRGSVISNDNRQGRVLTFFSTVLACEYRLVAAYNEPKCY